ncbi:MAG TPA: condensation domain-containing protein, partial [Thermoanaerobaculia bacterium]|nr:condensation domain-containing protein [Thermoanaerobaculia bacterium]
MTAETGEPTARRRLLDRLRDTKAARLGREDAIVRRAAGPAPLSFGQQRLWFIEQLEPGNPRFNILTAVRLKGRLQVGVLKRTLEEIAARHEALRTLFASVEGKPEQRISPPPSVPLPIVDLAAFQEARRERLLHEQVAAEAARPFDLAAGPLLRVLLLRLAADHHVLLLTMHQIAVDRWSRGILVREVVTLYDAFAGGRTSPLRELPIQYADFAAWQRGHLTGEVLERLLRYWKGQLAAPLPVLDLPADRPRPPVAGYRGRMQYHVVPQADLDRLEALARGEQATLFMVLLAALATLLHRYTGQEDMVLGSPIANRNRAETEGLIGFFLNLLALRVRPRAGLAFRDLLHAVKAVAVDAFVHQDLPFERLVDELAIERDLSRHPLFQVTLVLQNAPIPPLAMQGLTASLVEVDWGSTAFDLALFFWETEMWESLEKGLSLVTSASTDLFDATTVTRMVGHLKNVLRSAADHPDLALGELPLLAAEERQQLLVEWNDTGERSWEGESLASRFARQVETTPDAPALSFPDGRFTYRELDAAAKALADRLREAGVGPGDTVGILAERSGRTIVNILGVVKAGGTYLPLDPADPEERREVLMQQAGAHLLLAAEDFFYVGAGLAPAACILYTSGSTGAPKGVPIPQRAILRLACDNGFLALGPGDRVAQAANPVFDAALFEIWGSLLNGAELVGIEKETLLSPAALAAALRERGITTLFLPTALFHQLAAASPALFAGLRDLLIGGESPEPATVRQVLRSGPPARLLHLYGPTECTTFASVYEVPEVAESASALPIGRPIAGTRIHVLSHAMEPLPIGVPGEIHIGGDGVADGYLGRPDLTAQAFLPDPFSGVAGARLFCTGDLGRFLADGNLEFRGRRDRQLKVRGFRVEPGEIESALAAHPAVREAFVTLAESGKLLVAYAVWDGDPTPRDLADHLRASLPAYMVPAAIVRLEALPLTANGKVDAAALPP